MAQWWSWRKIFAISQISYVCLCVKEREQKKTHSNSPTMSDGIKMWHSVNGILFFSIKTTQNVLMCTTVIKIKSCAHIQKKTCKTADNFNVNIKFCSSLSKRTQHATMNSRFYAIGVHPPLAGNSKWIIFHVYPSNHAMMMLRAACLLVCKWIVWILL